MTEICMMLKWMAIISGLFGLLAIIIMVSQIWIGRRIRELSKELHNEY